MTFCDAGHCDCRSKGGLRAMRPCLLSRLDNAGAKFHFPFRNLSANTLGIVMITRTKMERCRWQNVPGVLAGGALSLGLLWTTVFHGKNSPCLGFVKCISMFKISSWEECICKGNSTNVEFLLIFRWTLWLKVPCVLMCNADVSVGPESLLADLVALKKELAALRKEITQSNAEKKCRYQQSPESWRIPQHSNTRGFLLCLMSMVAWNLSEFSLFHVLDWCLLLVPSSDLIWSMQELDPRLELSTRQLQTESLSASYFLAEAGWLALTISQQKKMWQRVCTMIFYLLYASGTCTDFDVS